MAALQLYANLPSTATGTAAKTIFYVKAPTNQRVKLLSYGYYFDGTLNSAQPIQLVLGRITTFTGSYTSVTLNPVEPECTETPQTVVGLNQAGTTEPSYTALKTWTVHPQLGYEYLAPLGQEDIVQGGGYLGIQITAPASVNVRGYLKIEE
jgi:hypothetical protein